MKRHSFIFDPLIKQIGIANTDIFSPEEYRHIMNRYSNLDRIRKIKRKIDLLKRKEDELTQQLNSLGQPPSLNQTVSPGAYTIEGLQNALKTIKAIAPKIVIQLINDKIKEIKENKQATANEILRYNTRKTRLTKRIHVITNRIEELQNKLESLTKSIKKEA